MEKIKIGCKNYFCPAPTIIVGVSVDEKPNYLNVSYVGIANREPAMLFISLNKSHFSTVGLKKNKAFSINIPSEDMLVVTDYCGLVSGKNVNKSTLFHTFYGVLGNVPMIEEFAVNMECQVVQELELDGSNVFFIGKVIESYSEEKYLTDNLPDIKKINPILFSVNDFNYYGAGDKIGKAWNIGKSLKQE